MLADFGSYSEFKKDFYGKVNDLSLFDCEEFNLLKVVLDGLKVDYAAMGMTKARLFSPAFTLINRLRRVRVSASGKAGLAVIEKELAAFNKASVLFMGGYDALIGGRKACSLLENVMASVPQGETILLHHFPDARHPSGDVDIRKGLSAIKSLPLTTGQRQLRKSLLS